MKITDKETLFRLNSCDAYKAQSVDPTVARWAVKRKYASTHKDDFGVAWINLTRRGMEKRETLAESAE